jgi:HPt (histidine-containing phosphotransfer) domain-containing protein
MIPSMPVGEEIPLGSRILAICDTFDSIVSDRVYRKASSMDDAFKELRRCAGKQFDPGLVEMFIDTMIQAGGVASPEAMGNVTKRSALQIGLLMEELTAALEVGDVQRVKIQAQRLSEAATASKLADIAVIANELQDLSEADVEVEELLQVASTLLDLCRMTQRAYLGVGEESRRRREELARRPFVKKCKQIALLGISS